MPDDAEAVSSALEECLQDPEQCETVARWLKSAFNRLKVALNKYEYDAFVAAADTRGKDFVRRLVYCANHQQLRLRWYDTCIEDPLASDFKKLTLSKIQVSRAGIIIVGNEACLNGDSLTRWAIDEYAKLCMAKPKEQIKIGLVVTKQLHKTITEDNEGRLLPTDIRDKLLKWTTFKLEDDTPGLSQDQRQSLDDALASTVVKAMKDAALETNSALAWLMRILLCLLTVLSLLYKLRD